MAEPIYKVDTSVHAIHHKRYRRRRLVAVVAIILCGAVVLALAYDLHKIKVQNKNQSVGATFTHQIAGPEVFRSTYFQFSDSNAWQYAANQSSPSGTKTTYLLYEGGVLAHSITVYVNMTPLQDDLAVTHVLPVEIKNANSFRVGSLAGPCGALYQPNQLQRIGPLSLGGTTMLCVPDSPQYSAVVGKIGGDYNLYLKRLDGASASYIIIYHNLTVNPDPSPFVRVMQSFQAI